jgi:uncharacterized damage-inducible protein DinB
VKMTEYLMAQLEREADGTRRTLERVPEGRNDWKPHAKSMPLGYLAALVAKMPSWIEMIIELDEYEMKPSGPSRYGMQPARTTRELVQLFEDSLAAGRGALAGTNDGHLMKSWRLLVSGRVVSEQLRHIALTGAVLSHLAHHRGQLGVYLRLNDAPVPALYGPSADEGGL